MLFGVITAIIGITLLGVCLEAPDEEGQIWFQLPFWGVLASIGLMASSSGIIVAGFLRGFATGISVLLAMIGFAFLGIPVGLAFDRSPWLGALLIICLVCVIGYMVFLIFRALTRVFGADFPSYERENRVNGVLLNAILPKNSFAADVTVYAEEMNAPEKYYLHDKLYDLKGYCEYHGLALVGFSAVRDEPVVTYTVYGSEKRLKRLVKYFSGWKSKSVEADIKEDFGHNTYKALLPSVKELYRAFNYLVLPCLDIEPESERPIRFAFMFDDEEALDAFVKAGLDGFTVEKHGDNCATADITVVFTAAHINRCCDTVADTLATYGIAAAPWMLWVDDKNRPDE